MCDKKCDYCTRKSIKNVFFFIKTDNLEERLKKVAVSDDFKMFLNLNLLLSDRFLKSLSFSNARNWDVAILIHSKIKWHLSVFLFPTISIRI